MREQQSDEKAQIETVRAAVIRPGDVTPAGLVDAVEFFGDLRRIDLSIGDAVHTRDFDALVDREVRA